jgi:hypothetical protein
MPPSLLAIGSGKSGSLILLELKNLGEFASPAGSKSF